MNLAPTSELEAVNALLATIGEAPVNTLTGSLPVDAAMARRLLHEKSREVQSAGWSFNQDLGLSLPRLNDGTIPCPSNALSIDVLDYPNVVVRTGKLYNRDTQDFVFPGAVRVDLVSFLPFNELPEYARQFIKVSAGRVFQDRTLGDESLHRYTAVDEGRAWARFLDEEVVQGDYNILRHSPSAGRVTRMRRRVP